MKRLFAIACWALAAGSLVGADRPPNIIVFLADDQGWGDLSVHGNTNLATPNIDSLAREGALLERFFVCPVCSPTRAEFLTGRYHARGGVRGVSTGQERLDLDEKTLAEVLKSAGYATGAFGKWHNGMQSPYHPNDRGFDEYYGFCSGHWGDYFSPPLDHNGKLVEGKGFIVDDFTDHALAFIDANRNRPFFCYLPYCTPHSPMQVPDRFWDKFRDRPLSLKNRDPQSEDVPKTRAALAMCENIDWNVGRVLQKLREHRLAEDTIVIYFSDNGPNSWRWNGGMKGRKGSTDEGGVRAPFLIRWAGQIPAGRKVPQIAGAIDILPTLVDLTGVRFKADKPLDGISIKPLLLGTAKDWPDREIVTTWGNRLSVRTQRYRLDPQGQLFDMVDDPGQERNIAGEKKDVADLLSTSAARWKRLFQAELGRDDRPFTVGYSKTTPLPARDGVGHGGIKRSAGAPNCSFFTNWKSKDDFITWDVEVGQPGRYEVVVHYTCAKGDAGSKVQVSFRDDRIEAVVSEEHDPPLRGKENDRVPRQGESYVKDFKPLRLGVLDMPRGRGQLRLGALEVAGKQVMDVRYVMLTRVDGK
jgi:arylsulfatase A-like enzyme